jgi:hypothetical protein
MGVHLLDGFFHGFSGCFTIPFWGTPMENPSAPRHKVSAAPWPPETSPPAR